MDDGLIRRWFEDLNWGQDKIDAEKADMLAHARLGYTTEVSVDWSGRRACSPPSWAGSAASSRGPVT